VSSPTRRKRRWSRLLLVVCGLTLGALLGELTVIAVFGVQPRFPRHVVGAPWGLRRNEPLAEYRHRSADVDVGFRIDARGLRSPEDVPYAKPPGVKRVVAVGDSFTMGYEVEEHECFARVLERTLRARGLAVEVLNAGVSGFSTAEECLYIERELVRYDPDLVLLSFFVNDLQDNLRTGLFALHGTELVEGAREYVPAGRFGDLLNTNPVLGWLSESSNAFAWLKEQATLRLKRQRVDEELQSARSEGASTAGLGEYERALCAAILGRLADWTNARGMPLVIQSIPFPAPEPPHPLVDSFPAAQFDCGRPGVRCFAALDVLAPWHGRELLYYERSHAHWTPLAHRLAGEALASVVAEEFAPDQAERADVPPR